MIMLFVCILGKVNISYIRKPKDVVWAYSTGALGQYVFAEPGQTIPTPIPLSGSVNFEISDQDQTEAIIKILMYAGVVIRDPQIVQAAAGQAAGVEQNQKS